MRSACAGWRRVPTRRCHKRRHGGLSSRHVPSMAEMLVEEFGDFPEGFLGFRYAIVHLILGVRQTLEDFKLRLDTRLPKLPVHAHRIAQQQVACPSRKDGG